VRIVIWTFNGYWPPAGWLPLPRQLLKDGSSQSRRTQFACPLAAALCVAVSLAPDAWGGGATQCPADNPLGSWIRFQANFHAIPLGANPLLTGCDLTYRQFLRLDMAQRVPKFTRAKIEAMLPPSLTGSARDNAVQSMLNQAGKQALLDSYWVTRIHYQVRRSACVKVPGGIDVITGVDPFWGSGTAVLGEDTPQGFRDVLGGPGGARYITFDPMGPELKSIGSLKEEQVFKEALAAEMQLSVPQWHTTSHGPDGGIGFPNLPQIVPKTANVPGPNVFLVEPTKCFRANGAQRSECVANPSEYSMLPFEGRSEWRGETPDASHQFPPGWYTSTAISWKICCGCAQIGGTHH